MYIALRMERSSLPNPREPAEIDHKLRAMKAFIDKRGLNLSHMQNVIADRSKKNDKATLEGKRKRIAQGSVLLKCAMYQETVSDALQRENTDHSNSEDPLSVLHDASTQADDSGYAVAVPSQSTQLVTEQTVEAEPLPPVRPYQCYGCSRRTDIRAEIIEHIHHLLGMYVHGDAEALYDLMDDLLQPKNWRSTFGDCGKKKDDRMASVFLSSFVRGTRSAKEKKQRVLLSNNLKNLNRPSKFLEQSPTATLPFKETPQPFKT